MRVMIWMCLFVYVFDCTWQGLESRKKDEEGQMVIKYVLPPFK